MREAFKPLFPEAAQLKHELPEAGTLAGQGFEPLFGPRRAPAGFTASDAAAREVKGASPGPDEGGDAAALQSMLAHAFTSSTDPSQPAATPALSDGKAAQAGPVAQMSDAGPASGAPSADQHAAPAQCAAESDTRQAAIEELEARVVSLQAEIAALRQAHAEEMAQLTAHSVPAMAETVTAAVKEALGPILTHPLMAAVEDAALDRFCAELGRLVQAGEGVDIRVCGPQALLDALRARWPDEVAPPELVPSEGPELVAVADPHVLSTRLAELRPLLLGETR